MIPLIGLIGHPYSGKDTVGLYLAIRQKWMMAAFGDKIKLVAMQVYSLSLAQVTTQLKEVIDPRWNKSPRELMQGIGELRQIATPDTWIKPLFRDVVNPLLALNTPVVISDVRVAEEADAILQAGGVLWRVLRPNVTDLAKQKGMTPHTQNHRLEQALPAYATQAVLQNNADLEHLYWQIDDALANSQGSRNRTSLPHAS